MIIQDIYPAGESSSGGDVLGGDVLGGVVLQGSCPAGRRPPGDNMSQYTLLKGEVQSRIIIISKERVKNFPTDWCKNYENRIRNKEVVTF